MPYGGSRSADLVMPAPHSTVLEALRPCAGSLAQHPERFVALLHHHLAALVPGGLGHLPDHGWAVCERTALAVLAGVTGERSLDLARPLLEQAGVDNFRDGFDDDQYLVGHALLRAVHEAYPGEWSTSLSSAWIAYFFWVRTPLVIGGTTAQEFGLQPDERPPRR